MRRGQEVADGVAEEDFQTLVSWEEFPRFDEDLQRKITAFCIGTPDGFVPPPELDFNKPSMEWYLNHSCEGNCGLDDSVISLRYVTFRKMKSFLTTMHWLNRIRICRCHAHAVL
ncbi:MAG: hypothetical protein DMG38_27460 [Acidobacteria bacterium]|nr:MAG: hypothetical protein DMG38_27460 [Acidobacteriota bacterium]